MQFSIVFASIVAVAAAQYGNGTAPYPTGTAAPTGVVPSGTSTATPPPFTGAAAANAGSVFALLAAGGVAMVSFLHNCLQA
jgi:hypothetical protein